jgi:hypothetical protein
MIVIPINVPKWGRYSLAIRALGISVFERDQSSAKKIARHVNDRFIRLNGGPEDDL